MQNLNALRPRILQVVRKGAISALERGPRVGGQVVDTQIRLHNVLIGRGTADSFIMSTAAQCVQKVCNLYYMHFWTLNINLKSLFSCLAQVEHGYWSPLWQSKLWHLMNVFLALWRICPGDARS